MRCFANPISVGPTRRRANRVDRHQSSWTSRTPVGCVALRPRSVGYDARLHQRRGAHQSGRCPFESGRAHVDSLPLSLGATPARRHFKRLTGSNNHFLITIEVGLDAVAAGEVELKPEFSTSWNPENRASSAQRSREFAHKAMLAWLTDALTSYRRGLRDTPGQPIRDAEWEQMEELEGSAKKLARLADLTGANCPIETDLVTLAVVWRNRLVHEGSSNRVPTRAEIRLLEAKEIIAEVYQGLDIRRTLEALDRSAKTHAPTFKETTSLVRAAHRFVESVDEEVLSRLSPADYLIGALQHYVGVDVAQRSSNVWGKGPSKTRSSVVQIGQSYGMARSHTDGIAVDSRLESLLLATPRQARSLLGL